MVWLRRSCAAGRYADRLTPAEAFWYVLGNIGFGGMYLAKVPVKKALEECGLAQMTSAERFWYVLMRRGVRRGLLREGAGEAGANQGVTLT